MGLSAGRFVRTGAVLEQVPVQEVEFRGDDRLVLVEEGGVMPSVDLQDFRAGCPPGGPQRRRRENGLIVMVFSLRGPRPASCHSRPYSPSDMGGHPARYPPLRICSRRMSAWPQC
jgi:hypothetical protein